MAKAQTRFEQIMDEYREKYDVDGLSSPNDKANLAAFINIQIAVEKIQKEVETLMNQDIVGNIDIIQRLNTAQKDLLERGMQLERALAMDKKTRSSDKADTAAEYINNLKQMAKEYLDKVFIRVECNTCKILVARIAPALEHTMFECHFQCSQCRRKITVRRDEKDIFFDFPKNDREWRKKHMYDVIQPKKTDMPVIKSDSELLINDEDNTDLNADELETEE